MMSRKATTNGYSKNPADEVSTIEISIEDTLGGLGGKKVKEPKATPEG